MAIGERIHFFRTLRGMTQKYLGMALGFPEKSADVRLAQYENGSRTPKTDLTAALAQILEVSPHALAVPDIDSYVGLMHTLFTLEDRYGLKICECDGEIHLRVDVFQGKDAARLHEMLCAWGEQAVKLKSGKSAKRTTTAGVTATRSLIPQATGTRLSLLRASVICWWKN